MKRRMKSRAAVLLLCALSAAANTACASSGTPGGPTPVMPQEAADSSGSSSGGAQEPAFPPENTGAASLEDWYRLKALEEKNELDQDELETSLRMGTIDQEAFAEQMAGLQTGEQELKLQRDALKYTLIAQNAWDQPPPQAAEEDFESLLRQYAEMETEEDLLELEEDRLKEDYRTRRISGEAFVDAWADLERRDDALDARKDPVKDRLEALGWDD